MLWNNCATEGYGKVPGLKKGYKQESNVKKLYGKANYFTVNIKAKGEALQLYG